MKQFDYLVLGSGIAGLSFALKVAPRGRVAIVTKKDRAESNTNYAQGGIAAVTSKEDSFELHVRDTLEAGAGLCDVEAVETLVTEGNSEKGISDIKALLQRTGGKLILNVDVSLWRTHSTKQKQYSANPSIHSAWA